MQVQESVHTPLGLCGVTAGNTVAGPGSPPPAWPISGNRTGKYHMRRPTTSKLLFADLACPFSVCSLKSAIIVETGVGPLLTISGRCPGKDLGIEFPDELRPEPAVGGSLDEALNPEHQVCCAARPGIPWTRQKNCQSSLTQRRMLKSPKLYCCPRTSTPG